MRIIYIGTVDFSYHCLKEVIHNGGDVVGVVTGKKTASNSDYRDLSPIAESHSIPVHYFNNINDEETVAWIREKRPDIIFCWGISQLIKTELLKLAPMGVVGVHPAALPQNRGRHPLIWALALGLSESALTFFFMDEGADSGPILSQQKFHISGSDDAESLYTKIKEIAGRQIADFLPQLISRQYQASVQDQSSANYWRKRSRKDGIIDWRMGTDAILNLVRALTRPYPGAETSYKGETVLIWKAEAYAGIVQSNIEPGKILQVSGDEVVIKCYDGAVILVDYEPRLEFREGDYL